MVVTLFGIDTDISPVQPENALSPMLVTSFPIIISWMDVRPLNHELTSLQCSSANVIPVQPWNAVLSIDVTLLGIVIDVNPLQFENAPFSIAVTLLGIVIDVSPEQPENA